MGKDIPHSDRLHVMRMRVLSYLASRGKTFPVLLSLFVWCDSLTLSYVLPKGDKLPPQKKGPHVLVCWRVGKGIELVE